MQAGRQDWNSPYLFSPLSKRRIFFHLEKKNHSSTAARTIHKAPLHVYIYIYTTRYCAHKLDSASIALQHQKSKTRKKNGKRKRLITENNHNFQHGPGSSRTTVWLCVSLLFHILCRNLLMVCKNHIRHPSVQIREKTACSGTPV